MSKKIHPFVKKTLDELELRAKAVGQNLLDLCKEEGIAETTYYRWLDGRTSPNLLTIAKISDKLPHIDNPKQPKGDTNVGN